MNTDSVILGLIVDQRIQALTLEQRVRELEEEAKAAAEAEPDEPGPAKA
jgi:hypothetical protein